MISGFQLLRERAAGIAADAAEACEAPSCAAALAEVLRAIGEAGEPAPVEPAALQAAVGDDPHAGRILRYALFHAIDLFHAELDAEDATQAALALRTCLHGAIPRPRVEPADFQFYDHLIRREHTAGMPEFARLQDLFHAVAQYTTDIIYIHDLNGMMLYINEPGLEQTRYTREDVIAGLSIYDMLAPEFLELVEARMEMPGAVSRAPYTIEIYTKDGFRMPMELATHVLRRGGRIVAVLGFARDLRLARRLETEIRRTHACLDAVLAAAPVGVFLLDAAGIVQDVNGAAVQMLGAPGASSLLGARLEEHLQGGPAGLRDLIAAADGEETGAMRLTATSAFGASLVCDVTVRAVENPGAAPNRLVVFNDVSLPTALKRSLVERERLSSLGEIMSGIAHDIGNPLTVIMGYAETMADSADESVRRRMEHILTEAGRCRGIVQHLVKFAQPRQARKTLLDVNELLILLLTLRQYPLRTHSINLETRLDPNLPPVSGDAHALQRVFLNLILNAQQALAGVDDRPRQLHIETAVAGERGLRITFADNGPGVPESIRARIFDEFFTTRGAQAAGLGLAIARETIEEHGGAITLETVEGEGATFIITLPAADTGSV